MRASAPHLPSLDGLRALAVLLIVVGHLAERWPALPVVGSVRLPSAFGVIVLFVLAGFLVTRSLLAEHDAGGDIALRAFFVRKLLRAYPVLLAFTVVTTLFQMGQGLEVPAVRVLALLAFGGNYYGGLAEGDEARHFVGHLWSLAVGAQFLVIWVPLLRWALRRGIEARLPAVLLVAAAVVGILRSGLAWFSEVPDVYLYNATEMRVDALILGAAAALWRRTRTPVASGAGPAWRLPILGALLAASALAPAAYRLGPGVTLEAAGLALILSDLSRAPGVASRALGGGALRAVSAISYSLLAWHLFGLALDRPLGALPLALRAPLVLALTLALAAISFQVLERPFRRRGLGRRPHLAG